MQEGKKLPKLTDILESDDEPEPDVVLEVPIKKVKLVVGPGGEKIKVIERKSKARLQVCTAACLSSTNWPMLPFPVLVSPRWPRAGHIRTLAYAFAALAHAVYMDAAGLQILKEEEELSRAFGSGPVLPKAKVATNGEAEPQMTKIMIFGNATQCETAQRMIQEAIENKVCCRFSPALH